MAELTSLGLLLKRYRVAAGLSQEALASRADLSARAISDLERGLHRTPHGVTLDLLSDALALSAQQRALLLAAAHPELAVAVPQPGSAFPPTHAHHLPAPVTALFGREREQEQAVALLRGDTARLVTITGPGGIGKTRLALQIALALSTTLDDGAVFIDLAPVRDAALVPNAIAQTLGLREQGNTPLDQQLRAYLYDKHMLLLLDNFEQVIESALLISDLLSACPHISCLVTSRAPLRLRAEHILPLAPLPLDDAIVLFRERARAVRPESIMTVTDVATLCERVDCLPLAIELVAGQISIFSLSQLLERLDQRMALELEGARDLPTRQRTLEAAIGWSYDLLAANQQRVFRALGVFLGGATLVAAKAVCWSQHQEAEGEALLALAALVDASLIQVEVTPGRSARFHMLDLVRTYAQERLRAEGEEDEACRRRATYFAALVESLMSSGFGVDTDAELLGQDLPNARAALEWAEEQRDAELGMRLAGFARLWEVRGAGGEAERWVERMLTLDAEAREQGRPCAPMSLRVERLYGYARLLLNHGNLVKAEQKAGEALLLAQQTNDQDGLASAHATLGMIAQARGDIEQATALFTESTAHAGPNARSEARYRALFFLAEQARMRGDLERAHGLLEDALKGAQVAGNAWDSAIITTLLGHVERLQHDYSMARTHYLEGLDGLHAFGSLTHFAWCLEGYSALLCAEGNHTLAARLCAVATTLRKQSGAPLPESERQAFEQTLACGRDALGEARYVEEWEAGLSLTVAAALAEAVRSK